MSSRPGEQSFATAIDIAKGLQVANIAGIYTYLQTRILAVELSVCILDISDTSQYRVAQRKSLM